MNFGREKLQVGWQVPAGVSQGSQVTVAVTGWLGTGREGAEQGVPARILQLPAGLGEAGVPTAGDSHGSSSRRAPGRAENTTAS